MSKTYKVTYKTYLNDRLKQISFHGKLNYPLYVQVTFDRKTIVFKSYYFELFSKPRYVIQTGNKIQGPSMQDIIKKENEVIDYVIDKTLSKFSLELFKREYAFYSKDLCDATEEGFIDYLFTFLNDKGMPHLATTIHQGSRFQIVYDLVQDLKMAFNKPLFEEIVENSFYAPPYLPLYGFMRQTKKWPMLSLTVMEWEHIKTKAKFAEYVIKHYPHKDAGEVMSQVDNWLSILRKQEN